MRSSEAKTAAATDRFKVLRRLGEGGMGAVYEVLDQEQDRRCALKVLKRQEALDELRFRREFREIAGYHHPNLVRLFDLVKLPDGHLGYTMELIEGGDLWAVLCAGATGGPTSRTTGEPQGLDSGPSSSRSGPFAGESTWVEEDLVAHENPPVAPGPRPEAPRCDLAALGVLLPQILDALEFLHGCGVIHRDLKPDNILVDARGRARLLDFGIIDRISQEDELDGGSLRGTLAYMAPELLQGNRATPAADLYALGVVLFRVLSGSPPFDGSSAALAARHILTPAPAIETRVRGLPPALAGVCNALLAKRPEARPTLDEIRERLGLHRRGARASSPTGKVLVGRDAELSLLRGQLAVALRGSPRAVLLSGPSGMGKSTIAEVLRESAREADALVLAGRCYEREALPFRALGSCMDELALHLSRWPRADRVLVASDAGKVAPMFEGFALLNAGAGRAAAGPGARGEAFAALRRIFAEVQRRRPVVLLIDDLQWTDGESVELLAALLAPPALGRVFVLGLSRPVHEREHPLVALRVLPEVTPLTLGPLDADAARGFLEAALGPREAGAYDALLARSQGNPFFLQQLAAALRDRPELASSGQLPGVDQLVAARCAGLSKEARALLDVASAVGAAASRRTLEASTPELQDFQGALDELLMSGLLTSAFHPRAPEGRRLAYDLSHDTFRERVYAALLPGHRRRLHQQLLDALEREPEASSEALLHHAQAIQEPARIHRYARQAAREAQRRLSHERAAELYALALRHAPADADPADRADIHLQASYAHHGLSDYPRVKENLGAALRLLGVYKSTHPGAHLLRGLRLATTQALWAPGRRSAPPSEGEVRRRLQASEALERLVEIHFTDNEPVAALRVVLEIRSLLEVCPPSAGLAKANAMLAGILGSMNLQGPAERTMSSAERMVSQVEDPAARASVALLKGLLAQARGDFSGAYGPLVEALEGFEGVEDPERALHAVALLVMARLQEGPAEPLRRDTERLGRLLERYPDTTRQAVYGMVMARLRLHGGELEEAARELAQIDALLDVRSHGIIETQRRSVWALLAARQGDAEGSMRHVEAMLEGLSAPVGPTVLAVFLGSAAEATRLLRGRHPRAERLARVLARRLQVFSWTQVLAEPAAYLQRAFVERRPDQARALLRRAIAAGERRGIRYELGRALEALAALVPPSEAASLRERARRELALCGVVEG